MVIAYLRKEVVTVKSTHIKGNTYVLDLGMMLLPYYKLDHQKIILLDAGLKERHLEKLERFLSENQYHVEGILCTHGHVDHIGNVNYFKEKYQCEVALPEEEYFVIGSLDQLELFFSPTPRDQVCSQYGHMIFKPDVLIKKNHEMITFCGVDFKVIHTPGHSIHHVGFITPDDVSYLGDALLSPEVMAQAKLPYSYNLLKDLTSKMSLYHVEASYHVLAHKGVYADIKDLITDNIYFYKNRGEYVLNHLETPLSFEQLFTTVMEDLSIQIKTSEKYRVLERILKGYVSYLEETHKIQGGIAEGTLKYQKLS